MQKVIDADDPILVKNTPVQAKSLLHSLKQSAGGIGFYVNANKTKLSQVYLGCRIY